MKREEFDGIQIKTIENVAFLIEHNFGCNKEEIESHKQYIATTGEKMMAIAEDIFALTKYANSIFPECMQQYWDRTTAIKEARAKVFSLMGLYQSTLLILKVDDNKYAEHIKQLKYQGNCIKNWLESDKDTYKKRSWFDVKIQ